MLEFANFYSITLTIATIVLILALAFVGWAMTKSKDQVKFPQLQNTCPDNWTIDVNGMCEQPESGSINRGNKSLSDAAPPITTPGLSDDKERFDPNHAGWSAAGNAACAKKKWASDLNIAWDTISNSNYC
jgi:hypothetical protein